MTVHLDDETWETVVRNMPIPSVDLVVTTEDEDEVLLGKRTNEPAKGTWFVPGGRVLKNEKIFNAVHRIAREELNTSVRVVDELGWYEHMYDTSDVGADVPKHYVPTAFVVTVDTKTIDPDDQHADLRWFDEIPKRAHEYTIEYLRDAGIP